MRTFLAGAAGVGVLLGLWPAACMESEAGESSCTSALMLPLPWSAENADTWGMVVAVFAAILTFVLVTELPGRPTKGPESGGSEPPD